jgi:hypothetical protein
VTNRFGSPGRPLDFEQPASAAATSDEVPKNVEDFYPGHGRNAAPLIIAIVGAAISGWAAFYCWTISTRPDASAVATLMLVTIPIYAFVGLRCWRNLAWNGTTVRLSSEGVSVRLPGYSEKCITWDRIEAVTYVPSRSMSSVQLRLAEETDSQHQRSVLSRIVYFAVPVLRNPAVVIQSSAINIAPQELAKRIQIRLDQFRSLHSHGRQ